MLCPYENSTIYLWHPRNSPGDATGFRPGIQFSTCAVKDYVRFRLAAESYPGVIYEKGAEVAGTVYFEIDETTLHKLDRYEDTCYKRLKVEVTLQNDEVIEAMAYIIEDNKKYLLSENAWDKQKFIEHDLDVFIRTIGSRN